MRIQMMCRHIWEELWRGAGLGLNKKSYSGVESWPTIQKNDFVMATRWKNRYRGTVDGTVWFNGDKIFAYELYLKNVSRMGFSYSREEKLIITPFDCKPLVYIQLAFDPTDFNTDTFHKKYVEATNCEFVPENIWDLDPELFEF